MEYEDLARINLKAPKHTMDGAKRRLSSPIEEVRQCGPVDVRLHCKLLIGEAGQDSFPIDAFAVHDPFRLAVVEFQRKLARVAAVLPSHGAQRSRRCLHL